MSKIGVSLKINVSEIEKARLFSGKKGKYLDATIFIELDQFDEYGNSGMITQDVTKDEKAQGVRGNILGNGKIFWSDSNQAPQQQAQQSYQQPPTQNQTNQAPPNYNPNTQGVQNKQPAPGMDDFDDNIPF